MHADTQGKYGTLSRRQNPSGSGLLDDDSGGATEGTGTLSRMRGLDFRMSLDRASYDAAADPMGVGGNLMSPEPTYKRQKETNKIADELSRLVIYTQAIKFTGLSSGLPTSISFPGGTSGASGVSTTMLSSLLEDQSSYTPPSRRSSFAVPPPTQRPRAASEVNPATISLISRKASDRKLSSPEPLPTWSSPGQRRPSICSRASSMNSSTASSCGYDGLVAFRLSGSGSAPGSSYDLARMSETPRAFQMSSVGESTGKKLVKKQSNELIV